jgi:hypothetical protein
MGTQDYHGPVQKFFEKNIATGTILLIHFIGVF